MGSFMAKMIRLAEKKIFEPKTVTKKPQIYPSLCGNY